MSGIQATLWLDAATSVDPRSLPRLADEAGLVGAVCVDSTDLLIMSYYPEALRLLAAALIEAADQISPVCAHCDQVITGNPVRDDVPRLTKDRPAWCSTECQCADAEYREYVVSR